MSRVRAPTEFKQYLAQAVLAGTPIVYVDTTEDERLEAVVEELKVEVGLRVFGWTCTSGLHEWLNKESPGTLAASPALAMAGRPSQRQLGRVLAAERPDPVEDAVSRHEAVVEALLEALVSLDADPEANKGFVVVAHDLVGAREQGPNQLRLFKDLFMAWEPQEKRPQRRTLIMTGVGWSLPPMLAGYVETRPLPLPSREEIEDEFSERSARLKCVGLTPKEIGERAAGLPKLTIEQAFRSIESECSTPNEAGVEARRERAFAILEGVKREEIRRTNLLEIIPLEQVVELGAFGRFKQWFATRKEFLLTPGRDALRPRGVMLLGFPGCGKSHAARWIAQDLKLPLVAMDLGRIQDRWVGSSEARLHSALRTIEATAPLVLFIDEIEKGFAGVGTETTGVTTRMAGQFLTWLSDRRVAVFVVATCNQATVPPELKRAGRFDANFLVLLPGLKERAQICSAVSKSLGVALGDGVLDEIARRTEGYTGAEIRQVVVEAAYGAGFGRDCIELPDTKDAIVGVTPLSRCEQGRELEKLYRSHQRDGGYREAGDGQ